ncbi:MAG TPA: hypothetical protein VJ233_06455 [Hyphomicrobiaceae bacterium]|nr:hypothetical protein [Hyphomicrobiaceae bacterium]
MQIFEYQQQRPIRGEGADPGLQSLERALPPLTRANARIGSSLDAEQIGNERTPFSLQGRLVEEAVQLGKLELAGVGQLDPRQALQLPDNRVKDGVDMKWLALEREHARQALRIGRLARCHPLAHGGREPRFAEPGAAAHENDLPLAGFAHGPKRQKAGELALTPKQGREDRASSLQPIGRALAQDLECSGRALEPFQRVLAEIEILEALGGQPPRCRRDDDRVGCRKLLQASREIRRFANDGCPFGQSFAEDVSDHHGPRGNANPDFEVERMLALHLGDKPADFLDDAEAGTYGTLGFILERGRVAEKSQHAVSDKALDESPKSLNGQRATVPIGTDHVAQILRIQLSRQRRGVHQVAEHHGELAPFRVTCRGARLPIGRNSWGASRQPLDRVQHDTSMTERKPERPQVVIRKGRQQGKVNVLARQYFGVLPEPDSFQPLVEFAHALPHGVAPE